MAVIESIGDTLVVWLRSDVIPYILFGTCLIVIIVSCVLNTFMLFMLKRRKLIALPSYRFLLQLVVVDFVGCALILIPTCVTALAKGWILSDAVCYGHAVLSTWLLLVSFGLVCLCLIERTIKQIKPSVHRTVFDTNVGVIIVSVTLWVVDLGLALLPVFGISSVAYDVYQASCVVFYSKSILFTIVIFTLTFVLPFILFIVTCILIFRHHRNKLKKKENDMIEMLKPARENNNTVTSPPSSERSTLSTTGIVPDVEETPSTPRTRRDTLAEMTMSEQETENNQKRYWRKLRKSTQRRQSRFQSVVSAVQSYDLFADDHKDEDHHLAVTYMIVYSFLTVCWLPFLILALANALNDSVWQGWYFLTFIFSVLSFIAKPIIYMAHNRHFRQNSTMALPQSVSSRVERIRNSISLAVNKLDKVVFVSPRGENKISTAVAVNNAAKTWKKRIAKPDETPIIQEEGDEDAACNSQQPTTRVVETDKKENFQEQDVHPNSADLSTVPIVNEHISLSASNVEHKGSQSPIPTLKLSSPDPIDNN